MPAFVVFRWCRPWHLWTRPNRWAPGRWQGWEMIRGGVKLSGGTRRGFGTAVTSAVINGVFCKLIPISYYGDLQVLQRRKVADGQGEGVLSAADLTYKPLSKLASVISHLALTKYEDGTARQPGKLRIETKGALWVVSLEDVDAAAVLRVNAPTFSEALQHANLLLESPDTLWEPAPWLRQPEGRKRKK